MASTYTPIATTTLSTSASNVTFSSIPSTYTDLVLVANTIVASGTGAEFDLRFNSDSGTNYSNTWVLGDGGTAQSGRGSNYTFADCGYLASNSGGVNTRIVNIQNYANSSTYKTVISRGSSVNGGQVISYVNLWRSTSAINTVYIYSNAGLTYAAGSTFTLYGIKAA